MRVAGSVHTTPRRALGVQLADEIDKYSHYCPTTLTLDSFVKFASVKSPASTSLAFLRKELPVRFANIMKEFHLLPEQLYTTPSLQKVEDWYEQSFNEILQFENSDPENLAVIEKFHDTLGTLYRRHADVVQTMAEGVLEMKEQNQDVSNDRHLQRCLQYFLDRFYLNRIGVRMLISQHLLLFTKHKNDGNHIGSIDVACDVKAIAEDAYNNARFLCEEYYTVAPECQFETRNSINKIFKEDPITMTYVPTHLYHMLFELIKNAVRAVVEYHDARSDLPNINVLICQGKTDVTIKISDQGGGIKRSELESLFNYTYSTAPKPAEHERTPLAGYGYGLPLSHLYARYFNGDLWLNSVDGFGTDAMICLKTFPGDASELLPVYNKTAQQKYLESDHVSDWSDLQSSRGVDSMRSHVGH